MSKLFSLYFSPTGSTGKLVRAFAQGFGGDCCEWDITLPEARGEGAAGAAGHAGPSPGDADVFVFAGPVYGGRSYKLLTRTICSLQGGGRPCVLLVSYGGRHYDMALTDLYDAASGAGFVPVGCGAFIAEHSFSRAIHTGRPDEDDLMLARDFGRKQRERLEEMKASGGSLPALKPQDVPQRPVDVQAIAMHREKLGSLSPNRPLADAKCTQCGVCADVCPLGLISPQDSGTIEEACIKCCACVKACPAGAMHFPQEAFRAVAADCERTFGSKACRQNHPADPSASPSP